MRDPTTPPAACSPDGVVRYRNAKSDGLQPSLDPERARADSFRAFTRDSTWIHPAAAFRSNRAPPKERTPASRHATFVLLIATLREVRARICQARNEPHGNQGCKRHHRRVVYPRPGGT